MRSARFPWLLLSSLILVACGDDDGGSNTNPAGTGGTAATGGKGGSAGSGVPLDCKPRCENRARDCGVPTDQAKSLCGSLCLSLTLKQLTCLEASACTALNDGSALTDCGISPGAGGSGGTTGGTAGTTGGTAGKGGAGAGGAAGGPGQGGAGSAGEAQGGAGQGGSGENTTTLCSDGADNDGDNFVDCQDKDCCQVVDCSDKPTSYCGKLTAGAGGAAGSAGTSGQGGSGGTTGGTAGTTGGTAGSAGATAGSAGVSQGGAGTGGSSGSSGQGGVGGQGGAATVTPGDPNRILLKGTVLAPSGPIVGSVLVEGEKITCVEAGAACANQPGASGATVIETNGIISPGLIDAHNHILFDIFDNDDWVPEKLTTNHNQWTQEVRYGAMLDVKQCFEDASQGKPAWCPAKWDGADVNLKCEMNKWGETKAIAAGTTSVIGLIGNISSCVGSLARTLGTSSDDLPGDAIQSSALVPSSASSANGVCANFASGKTKAYVIHNGEGTDASAKGEFEKLRKLTTPPGCLLAPQTAITHGNAFDTVELTEMAQKGMKLVWSPQSNLSLYGSTTNIPLARSLGITIALGPDWSMGGSVNMLNELGFADQWDNANWGNILSPKDLFEMATSNGAKVVGLDDQLGSLKVGYYADLFVFGGDPAAPYDALLATRPTTVRLTMVGGSVLYGDLALKAAALTPASCEDLTVCGASKFVCVAESNSSNKLDQTLAVIKNSLEAALTEVDALTPQDGFNFAPLAPLTSCP